MKPVSASSFGHAWLAEPWLARRKARLRLRLRAACTRFASEGWRAFLDKYRTLYVAPIPKTREIFENLRAGHFG